MSEMYSVLYIKFFPNEASYLHISILSLTLLSILLLKQGVIL